MTNVRIAHAEPRPGRLANGGFSTRAFLVVLADDAGHRAVPIWMQAEPGDSDLSQILETLSSAVPEPVGFAFLGQEMYADDYRGAMVTFRAEFRTDDDAGANRAGLFLRANREWDIRGPLTEQAVLADPSNTILPIETVGDWTTHEVTARVPDDADLLIFGIFLAGPGRIALRHPELRHPELRHPDRA